MKKVTICLLNERAIEVRSVIFKHDLKLFGQNMYLLKE